MAETNTPAVIPFDLGAMPDDIKTAGSLAKFKDVPDLARSYVNLEKKLGADKNHLFVVPKDGDMTEVYKLLGKPDKYEFPADLKTPLPDDYKTRLAETVGKLNLTDTQFKELLYFTDKENQAALAAASDRGKAAKAAAEQAFKDAFGKTVDQNVNAAKDALEMFGKGALWKTLEEAGLTVNADFIGVLSDIGRMGNEAKFHSGSAGGGSGGFSMSPAQATAEINRLKGGGDAQFTKAFHDSGHPQHKEAVDRMQSLYKTAHPEG